ncbi:DUF222 domain-containing protein [Microbacterium sp. dk485]|uniref:DUF222 domain-containing protein n=1 Tax=Microbacterium sp. dk485 TaxID=2560021 RepID=UPI0010735D90|nr:DUF222 domain-containing protein [Microbacterium sp. dk485]TFV81611.1 DUF222 domain-containing protein [Microbacterium sp. dk485]
MLIGATFLPALRLSRTRVPTRPASEDRVLGTGSTSARTELEITTGFSSGTRASGRDVGGICEAQCMPSTAIRENRNDSVELARIVDGLCANQEAVAALEAEAVLHFAAGMRIALDRMATRPRPQQTREMELRAVAAEIGLALRLNDRTVQRRMGDALELTEKFPATVDGLSAGRITLRHATAICDAGAVLDDPNERAAFETVVLDRAERETVARTKAFAVALAERMRPESITVRFQRAVQTRSVTVAEIDDGMAEVRAILPAAEAFAVHDRLTRQARAIRAIATEPDEHTSSSPSEESATVRDTRTLDQIRADLFCDMLLTGQPAIDPAKDTLPGGLGAIRAEIQVTVPVLTAAGQDDRGGQHRRQGAHRRRHGPAPDGRMPRVGSDPHASGDRHGSRCRSLPRRGHHGTLPRRQRRALPLPGVSPACALVRPRPQPRLGSGRNDRRLQHGVPVPTASHPQDRDGVDGRAAARRVDPLDLTASARLCR